MFTLTDEVIESTICSTSGLIVATVAKKMDMSVDDVSGRFLNSKTFALLRNKDTGYYWDSIAELIDMLIDELKNEQTLSGILSRTGSSRT